MFKLGQLDFHRTILVAVMTQRKFQLVVKQATHTLLESGHIHMMEQLNNYSYTQLYTVIQCGAPKIARLVYNSNNYGLWYANNYSYGGL